MNKYEKINTELEKFLKDYKLDLTKLTYADENGYPLEDAAFDEIFLYDFTKLMRETNDTTLRKLWAQFENAMDADVETKKYAVATEMWNILCEKVKTKVAQLRKEQNL